jgi:hypothetical protein
MGRPGRLFGSRTLAVLAVTIVAVVVGQTASTAAADPPPGAPTLPPGLRFSGPAPVSGTTATVPAPASTTLTGSASARAPASPPSAAAPGLGSPTLAVMMPSRRSRIARDAPADYGFDCYRDFLVPGNDGATVEAPGPTDVAAPEDGMYFTWRSGLVIWNGSQHRWEYVSGANIDGSNWWPWHFVTQFEQSLGYPPGYGQQGYTLGRGTDAYVYAWAQKAYFVSGQLYVAAVYWVHAFDTWNTEIVPNGMACHFP